MTHFSGRVKPLFIILIAELLLFCTNFLVLFSTQIRQIPALSSPAEKVFLLLFFGVFALAGIWTLSELLFCRRVALENGHLVIRRGFLVVRKIPYGFITRLQAAAEKMEHNQSGSLRNIVWYRGEKLRIWVGKREVALSSIYIKDYGTFKQKLARLAINARMSGPMTFQEQTDYTILVFGGLFVLAMTYINLFG